jgi:hypothetical protein
MTHSMEELAPWRAPGCSAAGRAGVRNGLNIRPAHRKGLEITLPG